VGFALGAGGAYAADADKASGSSKSDEMAEVVVTGTLIPLPVQTETAMPVTVISAEDISEKGFSTIADALQHASFSTGAVQGPQAVLGFTPGAQTISLFGLSPSYTKFLIDGRPIADYPALYNGTDAIVNISGIPTLLVDHIDILPGAQSSIYGSDAIAGVVNIVLKKKMDGPAADVRYGWTKDGGGTDRRAALSDGFSFGGIDVLVGGQYEKVSPIWGFQRPITNQYFANGSTPQTAERDWLIDGVFGPTGDGTNTYYFEDPANCGNVASQYGGSVRLHSRPDLGQYCGTFNAGYYTLNNGSEATQGFLRAIDHLNDHVEIFTDLLLDHDYTLFSNGTDIFESNFSATYDNYFDPNLNDYIAVLQHFFSPEEAGGLKKTLNKDTTNGIRATIGVRGSIVSSWTYSADFTYTENKLTENFYTALTGPIEAFYAPIFGPLLGTDPAFGVPIYAPDYANFYKAITPEQYASFNAHLNSYSRTEESLARLQITNAALFPLPGGDAGLAVVFDGGAQGWAYEPDPNYLDGGSYLYTSVAGDGHRTRWSGTTELRLPVVKMLTLNASGRYDDYKVLGESIDKATYNLGLEFRPVPSLLVRGRYGTAFKAPTLADEFQGQSGFFQLVTDYYQCAKAGFSVANIGNCPIQQVDIFGTTQGNAKLKPITATVWDGGIAWSPVERLSATVDYIHWKISNEIQAQPSAQVLIEESACRLGQLDPNSPTCQAALSQVQRDNFGNLVSISTPKVNVSEETLNVVILGLNYTLEAGRFGQFGFDASYSNVLRHRFIQFPGDPEDNLLEDPFLSQDFKTKENASVSWQLGKFGATVYIESYGRTPNFVAQQTTEGYATPGAGRVGTWTLANLSARYEVLPGLQISGNVINVFDKPPPPDPSTPGTQNQPYSITNYNPFGRSYFIEASYRFTK